MTVPTSDAILVTGAAGGIGAAVVDHLTREGWPVVAADLDAAAAQATLDRARAAGEAAGLAVEMDTTERGSIEGALDRAEQDLGPVSGVVTAAGIIRTADFLELDLASWDRTLKVNLTGTWLAFQSVAQRMVASGRPGAFVGIASVAGRGGRATAADYAASKAGVLSVVRSAALALADQGIRVNAVCPGIVETPMTESIHEESAARRGITPEESLSELLDTVPLGRMQQPADVATAVGFLLSPAADYVTGQALNVCGGLEFD